MSSPQPPTSSKTSSIPNVQLSSRLYALLRSEKAQGSSGASVAGPAAPALGGYSGLPTSIGLGQPHPLVAAAAQAALAGGAASSEVQVQKFEDLQSSLNQLRRYADTLPGGQYSQEEQLRLIKILREQIRVKSELLVKFKELGASGLLEQATASSELSEPKQE